MSTTAASVVMPSSIEEPVAKNADDEKVKEKEIEEGGDSGSEDEDEDVAAGGAGGVGGGAKKKKKKKKKSKATSTAATASATATADTNNNIVSSSKVGGKKAPKAGEEGAAADNGSELAASLGLNPNDLLHHIKHLEKQSKRAEKPENKEFKFWGSQPQMQLNETVTENEPIETKTLEDVRKDPINLPNGFEWCNINLSNPQEQLEMYTLLTENYVEDDNCQFRFDYSVEFLYWALTPPGFQAQWHVGVRNAATKKLLACITAIPAHIQIYDKHEPMVEINFLCVHKKLRAKRLAPTLIKEITRRVNLCNIWQATYTAGVVLPKPVGRCRYYHRPINVKKLIESKFSYLPQKTTLPNHIKAHRLPETYKYPIRPMTAEDSGKVATLLNDYLSSKTKLHMRFSIEEATHMFVPRANVVESFVLTNKDGDITDFCSFYHLPSSIIGNDKHQKMNAVYSFYNVATSMTLPELMEMSLMKARDSNVDVFNALDLMENLKFLEQLKFGLGDGFLQYYLYNWKCPEMTTDGVGLVLL